MQSCAVSTAVAVGEPAAVVAGDVAELAADDELEFDDEHDANKSTAITKPTKTAKNVIFDLFLLKDPRILA